MKKTISIVLALVLGLVSVSLGAEGIWTTKADMPTRRYIPSSGVVDGKIYVVSGTSGSACLSTVEEYDPATDTWTRKTNLPMVTAGAGSSVVNGKIYVMGGVPSLWAVPYSSVEEYDATTDTWTSKANMPTARGWLSSSMVNGKIYAIGGASRYESTPLSTLEEYDPATDTWTRKADMPTPRTCLSASVVNGKIYAIGGSPGYSQWYQALSTVEEYDPATDTWTTKADMPTPRTYISTCAVNGRIYAIGGLPSGTNHLSEVDEYDPATDTWRTVADMPTARSGVATSAVNGKIYAIGGWLGWSTVLSTVEEYDLGLTVSSPDFNGDGKVDIEDLIILIEHWSTNEPLCDMAPEPFGDGIIDAMDLEILMSFWQQEIFPPELIAYWKLDEEEGDIAYNSISDNYGIINGDPTWQPESGQAAGALEFDGIDDYVETGFVLDPADGTFSVFAWIQDGAPGQVVLSQIGGANWLSADQSEGKLMTELKPPTVRSPLPPLVSETIITDGNWHHIGLVWYGSHRTLYVDGVMVAEDMQNNLAGSTNGLYIGVGKGMELGTSWSGLVDDVRIYDEALSLARIETLAQ